MSAPLRGASAGNRERNGGAVGAAVEVAEAAAGGFGREDVIARGCAWVGLVRVGERESVVDREMRFGKLVEYEVEDENEVLDGVVAIVECRVCCVSQRD